MDKFLKWFVWLWAALAVFLNLISVAGMLMAGGFWDGVARVQDTYSPFNLANDAMEIVLLSPALLAYWWRERRQANKTSLT